MTEPSFTWSDKNPACQSTYSILTGLQQLSNNTTFDKAGQVPMRQLTYFPKVSPAPAVTRAHASQMAWHFCDRLLRITSIKPSPNVLLNQFIGRFETLFSKEASTLKDIAQAADEFLVFPGEE
jgi:hypothetical protein